VVLGGSQETDSRQVDAEAIDGFHADAIVFGRVVVLLDPLRELAVEGFE
jgi:hypothetical protein